MVSVFVLALSLYQYWCWCWCWYSITCMLLAGICSTSIADSWPTDSDWPLHHQGAGVNGSERKWPRIGAHRSGSEWEWVQKSTGEWQKLQTLENYCSKTQTTLNSPVFLNAGHRTWGVTGAEALKNASIRLVFVRYLSSICPVFVLEFAGILPVFVQIPVWGFYWKSPSAPGRTEDTLYRTMTLHLTKLLNFFSFPYQLLPILFMIFYCPTGCCERFCCSGLGKVTWLLIFTSFLCIVSLGRNVYMM